MKVFYYSIFRKGNKGILFHKGTVAVVSVNKYAAENHKLNVTYPPELYRSTPLPDLTHSQEDSLTPPIRNRLSSNIINVL